MKLIITIDTEEDNWGSYSTTDNSVKNIERIVQLQAMFDRFKVKPTYLITYPVATDSRSVTILKKILEAGRCEIGTHCHPWNTPPFEEEISERNSMLCNLSERLVFEKLVTLHEVICRNFGIVPVSFRAGRWGFGPNVSRALCQLGYRVDTSVSSFTDWRSYQGPDFSQFSPSVFRFDSEGVQHKQKNGALLEVPATVGFLQNNFSLCQRISERLENPLGRKLRVKGILDRLKLVNKVRLSPELADVISMKNLSKVMKVHDYPCINFHFHSTSLLAKLSPFVRTREEEDAFFQKIQSFIMVVHEYGWVSETLENFEKIVGKPINTAGLHDWDFPEIQQTYGPANLEGRRN